MRWNLLPREPYFFKAFVSLTREVHRGAALLVDLFTTHPPNLDLVPAIHEVEHSCDTISHAIIQRLNQTFVTPIDREDIYALVKALNDVMDTIGDASARIAMHRVVKAKPGASELADVILLQSAQLVFATEHLPEFSQFVPNAIHEIKRLEEQADRLHMKAVGDLFDSERDPIEVIKWKEILDFLEASADRAEGAAHVLESIYVKHA